MIKTCELLMKRAMPLPPSNAPKDTNWVGGPIPWFSISLSISAEDLDPDEITRRSTLSRPVLGAKAFHRLAERVVKDACRPLVRGQLVLDEMKQPNGTWGRRYPRS
jgi:hypothetical protein